jgi:short-subunit dehydrogenase involved in D-alanine esterification of teichoic acids
MAQAIVTGGASLIGVDLAEKLSANNTIIIIEDLSAGKNENLNHLLAQNIKFIEAALLTSRY